MTIEEFMVKEDIRNKKIVLEWIKKKYIPGVIYNEKDEIIIPNNARIPYTERGKCKGYSIYKSFVKAYYKGKNVVPALYNITDEKFKSINTQLEEWGLVQKEKLDGLIYYNATPKGAEFISFTNTQVNKFIQQVICSASHGITNACFDKIA